MHTPSHRVRQGLAWFQRFVLGDFLRKWIVLGVLIGVAAGLGAIAFYAAIGFTTRVLLGNVAGYVPPLPRGEGGTKVVAAARAWLLPVVTTLGGLASGLLVFTLAPEAEGHGTDAAIEAFHKEAGTNRQVAGPDSLVTRSPRRDPAA